MTIQINGTSGISGVDGSAATPALQGTDTNTGISFGTDEVNINTGGTTRATVDSSGRVGIGTTQPATPLTLDGGDIKLTTAASTTRRLFTLGGTGNYSIGTSGGSAIAFIRDGSNNDSIAFETHAQGSSHAERMRITSGGVMRIGATVDNPGDSNTNTGIAFETAGKFFFSHSNDGGHMNRNSDGNVIAFRRSGSEVGRIYVNSSSTSYITSSDYRLKENVVDLDGAITRVKQLAPKRFNFIADTETTVDGFLAHEAQAVVPECVTGTKDEVDDEGNPVYQGIDQSKLVPLLTAALQEALAKIETLETANASLEARLTALEGGTNP